MKTTSPVLGSTLLKLVNTRLRFVVALLCQISGFVFTLIDLHLAWRQVWYLGFWMLYAPILFLVTARLAVIKLHKGSESEKATT